MTWDEESVIAAADTVEFGGAIWILYLSGNKQIGVELTSDYHTHKNSVRTFAQNELDLDDPRLPTVKSGYRNLCRKTVVDSVGRIDTIINEHKTDILSLTTHGKRLMTAVRDDRIERAICESIGIEVDSPSEPWWVDGPPNPDAKVFLRTFSDREELDKEQGTVEVIATFTCGYCRGEIEHSYPMALQNGHPVEGWQEYVTVTCERGCTTYRHRKADQYNTPEPTE